MAPIIPTSSLGRRLAYELIYLLRPRRLAFNPGYAPVECAVANDPDFKREPRQFQLYAELLRLLPLSDVVWRTSAILEVGAGAGVGIKYIQKRYRPRMAIGIELSAVAAWRGRRRRLDLRQGDATKLPFDGQQFDCIICVDALQYFCKRKFIQEVYRALKPGGACLLAR